MKPITQEILFSVVCAVILATGGYVFYLRQTTPVYYETITVTVNTTELVDGGYIDYGYDTVIINGKVITSNLTPVIYYYNRHALPGELGHKCIGFWTHTDNGTPIIWVSTDDPDILKS